MHHFCVLAGYGAEAINPYLAFETLEQIRTENGLPLQRLRGAEELHQGARQGHAEGDVQDGHLDLPVLLRRADLRRGRPAKARLSRSTSPAPRRRSKAPICTPSPRRRWCATRSAYGDDPLYRDMLDVGGDYAFRLRGEAHAWTPQIGRQAAARGARQLARPTTRPSPRSINDQSERLLTIRGLMQFKPADRAGAARRGRAGARDRQALRHRRDELRLDQPRGAHDAGDRDEPHRRQVEHRRGRRGGRALQAAAERRFDALGDQAGRLGPVRRHRRIPGQRRRPADQDGAGRQARRGRPAARPQGRQGDRQGAPFDARRRPDLAAAAPRHLFDRGSGAADPRSEERQPARPRSR